MEHYEKNAFLEPNTEAYFQPRTEAENQLIFLLWVCHDNKITFSANGFRCLWQGCSSSSLTQYWTNLKKKMPLLFTQTQKHCFHNIKSINSWIMKLYRLTSMCLDTWMGPHKKIRSQFLFDRCITECWCLLFIFTQME